MDNKRLMLTTPVGTSLSNYRVTLVELSLDSGGTNARVYARVLDNLGGTFLIVYAYPPTPSDPGYSATRDAKLLIQALNTANLSVKSLHQRLLEQFVLSGDLPAGVVS